MANDREAALVTGATGFIGRRLCQRLQRLGAPVTAVGRHRCDGPWDRFIELDLVRQPVPDAVLAGIGTVYHLAGKSHAPDEAGDAASHAPVIVEATRQLLEACARARVPRFIYVSSVKAMGEGNPRGLPPMPIDEDWPHTPQGPYGRAKLEAEQCVRAAGLRHTVVLRPVMVFGPGANGNLSRMVEAVRRGRFPPLRDNGNRRSMIHVDDVVEFLIRAAQRPLAAGRTYILAGPESPSTRQLYGAIRAALGLPPQRWSIPPGLLCAAAVGGSLLGALLRRRLPFDRDSLRKLTGSAWYTAARAERELAWTPRHRVTEWLQDQG
jgi:nucleoside-diphosphate-sugar epimerase